MSEFEPTIFNATVTPAKAFKFEPESDILDSKVSPIPVSTWTPKDTTEYFRMTKLLLHVLHVSDMFSNNYC
jgi:hypothetical protein